MHVAAPRAIAVEDSTNGIASAANAGLTVIAVPNKQFPPSDAALARAAVVLDDLDGLTVERVEAAAVAG
jgi:beta-phosphoglucomutase-like phosphatase (HAD superfamily)